MARPVDGVAGDDLVQGSDVSGTAVHFDSDVGMSGPSTVGTDRCPGVLVGLGDGGVVHEPLDEGRRVGVEGHALVGQAVTHPGL